MLHERELWTPTGVPTRERTTSSTGSSYGRMATPGARFIARLATSGTGGMADTRIDIASYLVTSDGTGQFGSPVRQSFEEETSADYLGRIRDVFGISVSQLAREFGVSRPTVYNWLYGGRPKPEHHSMLCDLAGAADVLVEAGIRPSGSLLKRKVRRGLNLFETARAGCGARDAASDLVRVLRQEADQRKRMADRLAGRKSANVAAEFEFPAENDAT